MGNAFAWVPPERMDFVSTMVALFPRQYEEEYVDFVLRNHLKEDGKLLIHQTGPRGEAERTLRTAVAIERFRQVGYKIGHDPVKNREVYVAVLTKWRPG